MDSGATKGVVHPKAFPDYDLVPSPGSRQGACFGTAGQDELPNLGMKVMPAVTAGGLQTVIQTQCAEVSLPLSSVGEYTDAGNLVAFGPKGGIIQNIATGQTEFFPRDPDGVYMLELWIPPAELAKDFPRPGSS